MQRRTSLTFATPGLGINLLSNRHSGGLRSSLRSSSFTAFPTPPKRCRIQVSPSVDKILVPRILPCRQAPRGSTPSADSAQVSPSPTVAFRPIRKILALLSFLGIGETAYLTFNKLFSSAGAICSTQGCLDVLEGPFSSFLGIPLTLFGTLAYGIFAYLTVWPLASDDETNEEGEILRPASEVYESRDAATRPLMFALSSMMTVFSIFLMALLFFVIKSMCPYCIFSAVLSTALFALTAFVGRAVPDLGDALRVGAASVAASCVGAAALFFVSLPAQIRAQPPSEPQGPPAITMKSTSDTLRIASKLMVKSTKMYGAYWCSHCYDQKQRFGKKAFAKIEYVECDKHGINSQYQLCRDKRIPGYPTWEIDGELYPGEIELSELERLVDESGSR